MSQNVFELVSILFLNPSPVLLSFALVVYCCILVDVIERMQCSLLQ